MFAKIISMFVAAVTMVSCAPGSSGGEQSTFELAGSEWGLESGADVPFIQFTVESKAVGNGGCNRFNVIDIQSEDQLSFGPIMATKMACMDLDKETEFFKKLGETTSFEGDRLKLVLKSDSGEALLSLKRRDWD